MSAATAAFPDAGIERWELHSELSVVSAEVRKRALELLPERHPGAYLSVLRRQATALEAAVSEGEADVTLPVAVATYALVRLLQTLRSGTQFVALSVGLPLLVELLH